MTAARVGGWRAAALEEEDQHDVTAARVGGWRAAALGEEGGGR